MRDLLRPPFVRAAGKKHHYGLWGRRPLAAYPGWDGKTEMENALIVAPPGRGKGMLIKANLTMWYGSAVIADLKGDFYRDLGGAFTQAGHRCFVLRTDGLGHCYDPFAEFQGELGLGAAAAILLAPERDGGHKIFGERAAIILSAMMMAARVQAKPILPYLKMLLADGMERCLKRLQALADPVIDRKVTSFLSEPADLADWESVLQDRFIQSCWANLTTRIEPLLADPILAVTSKSDFTAATLRNDKVKVFLQFSKEHLEATLPLYRLIVESLTRGLTQSGEINPRYRESPVWFVHDEAHLLTPTNLPEHLNSVRDWGVVMWVVLQSRAQLRERYGHDNASTIEAGCGVQVYYRPNDHAAAEHLSERLGEMPVPRESRGERGRVSDKSVNTTLATQPLLRPRSISQLKLSQTIVLAGGRPPIAAKRVWPTDLSGGKRVFVRRQGRLLPRYPAPELLQLELLATPEPLARLGTEKRGKNDQAAKGALEKIKSLRRSNP